MKDRVAIQAAGAGPQSVESGGTAAVPPFADSEKPRAKARTAAGVPGLTFPRFFTEAGVDPFHGVEWEIRAAVIGKDPGAIGIRDPDGQNLKACVQQPDHIQD